MLGKYLLFGTERHPETYRVPVLSTHHIARLHVVWHCISVLLARHFLSGIKWDCQQADFLHGWSDGLSWCIPIVDY
jgi:hypothetical protein